MPAPFLRLPPTDRVLSSRTGWTRAHWEAVADHLLDSVVPFATPGFAQYRLPGRNSWSGVVSDGLEGYARTFLLAAFRIAGAGGTVDERLVERYARGLAAGVDPASGEAWPVLTDCSQQMVEAASIAVGLHETRPWIWDRLDCAVQQRVVDWFSGFVGARTWDNNWRLFQVVSEQFLASVGAPFSQGDIDGGLDRIEDWYLGDGWYTDGDGRNFDYYGGWAMHLYPLLWARIAGAEDGGRAREYRARLARFLADYPHFFGGDGAPVHQGRSLAYRFAATAPVWMGALADCSPLAPGLTRRLASGAVRHFVERGAPDERGLLTLGWHRTFLPATQSYSGPASPYWASKGFLGLLLPADHPVWTAREAALPVEESDRYTALPVPGWLLHGTRHDGIVRLVNHGSDHNPLTGPAQDDPHYAKFGYSTATAPESAPHAWERAVDGHLALVAPDGTASRRVRIHPLHCDGRTAASRHDARLPGGEAVPVESTSVLHGPWEVRIHRVGSGAPHASVREGGHAVAGARPPSVETGPGWALARTADGLTSAVIALHGWDDQTAVARQVAANAFGSHSATPYLSRAPRGPEPVSGAASTEREGGNTAEGEGATDDRDAQDGHGTPDRQGTPDPQGTPERQGPAEVRSEGAAGGVHVTLVVLSQDTVDPAALRQAVRCEVHGDLVRLTFPGAEPIDVPRRS